MTGSGQIRRAYTYRKKRARPPKSEIELVNRWWKRGLTEGTQLVHGWYFVEGYDYFNDARASNWKRMVALDALYFSYRHDIFGKHYKVGKMGFAICLSRILSTVVHKRVKICRLVNGDGRLFVRPRRTFYIFQSYRTCVQDFRNQGY